VVQQAYVCGVSTRRVDQLVESLGLRISRSEVSRVCGALDEHVEAFRTRPLEGRYLAFYASPAAHWRKLRSTNPLERFNKEIGRRTDVVGIFPDDRSLIRLAGMLCIEQNDEWLVGRGYLSAESISLVLTGPDDHIDKGDQGGGARAPSGLSSRRLHRRDERRALTRRPGT
jgi:transposase-like protein